jgi:hypothetical protein
MPSRRFRRFEDLDRVPKDLLGDAGRFGIITADKGGSRK